MYTSQIIRRSGLVSFAGHFTKTRRDDSDNGTSTKHAKYSKTLTPIESGSSSQNKICAMSALVIEPRIIIRKQTRPAHWQKNSTVAHVRPMARKRGHEPFTQRCMLIENKLQNPTKGAKAKTKMIKKTARTPRILQAISAAHLAMSNQDFQYKDTPASNTGVTSIT